jgi:hypothetical protein
MLSKDFVAELAALASASYPQWQPTAATLHTWTHLLGDFSEDALRGAMVAHVRSSKFPPSVAEIVEQARLQSASDDPTAGEAWAEVTQVVRYTDPSEVRWSHPRIGAAVDAIGGYHTLANAQAGDRTANRARFIEAYREARDVQAARENAEIGRQIAGGPQSLGSLLAAAPQLLPPSTQSP